MTLKIIATGRGVPKRVVTNDELTSLVNTSDEWIVSRTGIKSRHICTDETLTDLCVKAGSDALAKAKMHIADVEMIMCATIGGDFVTPSLACAVAERLQANCPAFDINGACSGFVYGLDVAAAYLAAKKTGNVLLICGEMMSRHADWSDRSTCVLFGDGAGAVLLVPGDALKYINLTVNPDTKSLVIPAGSGNSPFISRRREYGFLHMDGQEIFKFAVNMVERQVKLALDTLGMTLDEVDYFILHQANKRIIDSARIRLKQPEEKFPVNINRYGNISSATIPILLDEMLENGQIKQGDILLMSAFGAGLTTGTCVMVWQ
jgi:3-oxoacyl-[acyl-carrier-protein] synthase III